MLSSKRQNELLARVNFPLYAVRSLSERHVLVAGGGGNAKSGILNVIEIYELIQNGSTCRAESVTHYETGSEAIMSCAVYSAGKYYILFASMAGGCQIYKIKYEIAEDDHIEKNSYSDKLSEPYIRKRVQTAELDSPSQISNLNCKTSDTNDNVIHSKLRFKIQPLESFQTDFSDDPYQKLVKFSSSAKLLVTGGADGHVRLWKYPELKKIHDIAAHLDDVDDLDICPSGKKIVTVSRDGYGKVWNSETGCLITDLKYVLPHKSDGKYIFRSCRFGIVDDKNELVLFGTLNPSVRKRPPSECYICKWDTKQFSLVKIAAVGTDMLSVMAISDNGRFIALGTQDGTVKMYIAFNLQLVYSVDRIHNIFVTGLEFLPSCDESRRITGGHEASLISISVDNHIIIHHIPERGSMSILTVTTLFILTLLFIFVIMDFFNL